MHPCIRGVGGGAEGDEAKLAPVVCLDRTHETQEGGGGRADALCVDALCVDVLSVCALSGLHTRLKLLPLQGALDLFALRLALVAPAHSHSPSEDKRVLLLCRAHRPDSNGLLIEFPLILLTSNLHCFT